jgi:hypothetical protein
MKRVRLRSGIGTFWAYRRLMILEMTKIRIKSLKKRSEAIWQISENFVSAVVGRNVV